MIAIACKERPDYLYVTLRSLEKYDPYWWSSTKVFDSNSKDKGVAAVIKDFGLQHILLPEQSPNAPVSSKAHDYRKHIQKWFLENTNDDFLIHIDADVFIGPGAISCLADARECGGYDVMSAMNFAYFDQWMTGGQECNHYMIFDMRMVTEQCWIATRKFLETEPQGWVPPNFAPVAHTKGFVEDIPIQHLGAFCPIITHWPPKKMLMHKDKKIVQPAPFDIDYDHFDIKTVQNMLK